MTAKPEVTLPRTAPATIHPSECDYSGDAILLGRLKSGTAPESRRVVHVLPLAADFLHNPVVAARCGTRLPACDLQLLPSLAGMPCELCVMSS
jgi:hypothetical protein